MKIKQTIKLGMAVIAIIAATAIANHAHGRPVHIVKSIAVHFSHESNTRHVLSLNHSHTVLKASSPLEHPLASG
jgi:hypothetical protein